MEIKPNVDRFQYNHPEVWEAINERRFQKEAEAIGKALQGLGASGPILDIGCGTGAHIALLSRQGYACKGLDVSRAMLEHGRRRYPEIELLEGDMRTMSFKEEFGVVLCLNSSFLYNLTDEDMANTLAGVEKALVPGGIFILDAVNPMWWLEGNFVKTEGSAFRVGDEQVRRTSVRRIIHHLQLLEDSVTWEHDGETIREVFYLRLLFPAEAAHILREAGLTAFKFIKDFDLDSEDIRSNHFQVIAKKP
ncbi:MAG: class I SAM-dependent methyltransferase [candidate division WOR-3 bacterium]